MESWILWKSIEDAQVRHIRHLELIDDDMVKMQLNIPIKDWNAEGVS